MGQLEKYGLYVLCLVIFLILGVTIWGDAATPVARTPPAAMHAGPAPAPGAGGNLNAASAGAASRLQDVFGPSAGGDKNRSNNPPKPVGKPVDAAATQGEAGTAGGAADTAVPAPTLDTKRPTHKVAEGESYDSIARTKLGDSSLRDVLVRLNSTPAHKLQVGQEIVLPSQAELAAHRSPPRKAAGPARAATTGQGEPSAKTPAIAPLPSGERFYTIAKGDNLERIAQVELGSRKRVDELRKLNPGVVDTKLAVGQRIKLPKK
jgi:LysM repeat protein